MRERRRFVALQVKVSSKHQIAVPAAVRRELAIDAGDHLMVEIQDGVIFLIPEPTDPIEELRGLGREIWDGVDAQDYINGERNGW
jgi:AbrB family looped-hinge helix DNA binding protein